METVLIVVGDAAETVDTLRWTVDQTAGKGPRRGFVDTIDPCVSREM